ncbi:uncharacterized protein LOC133689522 [Populus nigra]|uniref:uncharacterized protein LOC133689522 n=1 Tax=Populus nigra TaxID=3691 RepID=UPI002B2654F2|nr:uncharacterized protein LOC133689522 [Populus nigra]
MGTHVAIVGPNGDGKSTLLNLLEGDLLPTEVESAAESEVEDWKSRRNSKRYSQHFVDLLMKHQFSASSVSVRTKKALAKWRLFERSLSIDALADALDEFTGGVVLVSHDSRLISRDCHGEEKSEIGGWKMELWILSLEHLKSTKRSFELRLRLRLMIEAIVMKLCSLHHLLHKNLFAVVAFVFD